jgi:MoaA/NifB/PqqE/SkfB family radical SAM enzyme
MENLIAILSMLHEAPDRHSATRLFRERPVLDWTLRRLAQATSVDNIAILCWDDQVEAVNTAATGHRAGVVTRGPRQNIPFMSSITASRRWADGWRSGLLGTCELDLGFAPEWVSELMELHQVDAALLVDPASGLLDPELVESLLAYAGTQPDAEMCFMQAAPGLTGTLLRRELVDRLAIAKVHPGRMLTYDPDHHTVDPIGKPGSAPVPTPVARSTYRFKLDCDRQIARVEHATAELNGHLMSTRAEALVTNLRGIEQVDRLPREVVLELNTNRDSAPIFWPGSHHAIQRPPMSLEMAQSLFHELGSMDDIRLTLGGVGDPLLSPQLFEIIAAAKLAGIAAINLETDLISATPEQINQLANCGLDVVSVHFPAAHSPTYAAVMNIDAFTHVLKNVNALDEQIKAAGNGTPLIAMIFTKMQQNLGEMELWYEYWMRRFGHGLIIGPSDFGQQIPDYAVADMAPPIRKPCNRLASRMTILSDGTVVSCEQDFWAKQPMGIVGIESLSDIWRNFHAMRKCHGNGQYGPVCGKCREWHRS